MDSQSISQLVHAYVDGWIAADREKILRALDPDCVVIESYGPTYRGSEMVGRWIDSWFVGSNVVNSWDVTSLYIVGDACFFEWVFDCTFAGNRNSFEGASIARLREEKIVYLREYAMTAKRYEWER